MIVDKKKYPAVEIPEVKVQAGDIFDDEPLLPDDPNVTIEEVELNPLEEVYLATRRVLESVMDPDNPTQKLFQTIKIDNGQFERIVRTKGNTEYAIGFPAAFIRFVNVRFLTSQQRIGEGRATMRIRYVLNDLNNSDDIVETRGFRVFHAINDAIQDAKDREPALNERCNLTYWDMLESLDNGVQPYWIDYEIWFRTASAFQYRNWVDRYLVVPPFTDHKDAPDHDEDNHIKHESPKFEEVAKYEPSVEIDIPETPEVPDDSESGNIN
jgi:hypothetical protein